MANETYINPNLSAQAASVSAELVYQTFDHVPFAVAVLRGPELIIEYINQYNLNIWQALREDVLGKPLFVARPDIQMEAEPIHRQIFETGERFVAHELPISLNENGEAIVRYFDTVIDPIQNSEGVVVAQIATTIEVTSQVNDRKRVEASESRLRLATEAGALGTFEINLLEPSIIFDERLALIFGLDPAKSWNYEDLKDRLHPDDVAERNRAHEEALITGAFFYEARLSWPDGSVHWTRFNGKVQYENGIPARLYGTVIDITKEKEMALQLQASEEKYRSLFQTMEQGFCIVEVIFDEQGVGIDYRFLEVNSVFESQTGLQGATGRTALELIPDLEAYWPQMYGEVAGNGRPVRFSQGSDVMGRWFDVYAFKVGGAESHKVAILFSDITIRKKGEKSLQESESRFRSIADEAPAFIFMGNANAEIEFVNKTWIDFTGFSDEKALGQAWAAITHPDDVEQSFAIYNHAYQKHTPYQYEMRQKGADGKYHWLLWKGIPRFLPDGEFVGILGFGFDITELKTAQEAIRESEERFQNLIRTAEVGIILLSGKEMRVDIVNNAYGRLIDRTPDELLGKELFKVIPDAEAVYRPVLEEVYIGGKPLYLFDSPYDVKKDGRTIAGFLHVIYQPYRNSTGVITGVLALIQDVTEVVKARQALEKSEAQFRSLANAMPQIVWTADASGAVTYFNGRVKAIQGAVVGEDGKWNWVATIHPNDQAPTQAAWEKAVTEGIEYEMEHRVLMKDGNFRWHLSRGIPQLDAAGKVVQWYGTTTDIHDQKSLSRKLEDLVDERTQALQRSNEDLQQFAHVASHDLKEPVRKVMTFANRLKDELGADGMNTNILTYLSKIENSAIRMYSMIDGVLLYSTLYALEQTKERVDLNELMESITLDLELLIQEKKAKITYTTLPPLNGSAILFYQLFYNLVGNSLKFARQNVPPVITIEGENANEEEMVKYGLRGSQRYAKVSIQDNGIGFHNTDAEKIFGSFTRLHSKDKYEGTGLGLSLCKKITERHKGHMIAEGQEGQGARFTIWLPTD